MNTVKKSEVRSPLREVRLRVAFCFGLVMLSSDALNPVKICCSAFGIDTKWALFASCLAFIAVISANAKELIYFSVKVFFHSILSIYFSSMEVLGRENIPEHGPVIFTGNHMNQFVDGGILVVTTPHRVGLLVAEKSYHKRIIGDFAKAMGGIPVARPQDNAQKGPGKIMFDGLRIKGSQETKFSQLKKGDRIRPGKSPESYRVKEVISDNEGVLAEEYGEASPKHETFAQGVWTTYDVLQHVDQAQMFDSVQKALANGQCLGIFPEGGSHDRTDLLPLKAGVAAIALGAQEKYGVSVPIVPVGFNYFRAAGHRFRGRVVVEYGAPIHITKDIMEKYQNSKREGYQHLLREVEDGMRSVIVTATDYQELKLIHTVRRLFQQSSTDTPTKEKQDIARRLSVGVKILKEKYGGDLPSDIKALTQKLEDYQNTLDHWGLKDYQLQGSYLVLSYSKMIYTICHSVFILSLASIPSLLLNLPVGLTANYWAYREAQKDLKASRVKLAARDVLLSKKILFSLVAVPVLWVSYAVLAILFTNLKFQTVLVLFLCFPAFSYLGVMAVEAGMTDLKDLRPAFLRLMPEFRKQAHELPKLRQALRQEVRDIIRKYGPETGAVYLDPSQHWEETLRKSVTSPSSSTSSLPAESFNDLENASNLLNNITSLENENESERNLESNNSEDPESDKNKKAN